MNKKELSILHISTARSWRGGEQQIAYLIAELAKQNTRQFVVCIKDAPLYKWCLKNNIPAKGLKKRSSLDLSFAYKLKKYSQKNNVQIWHSHDSHAHGFGVYANALFGANTPLVVSRRVDFPVASSKLSTFKYNHHSVKKILCVSAAIANIVKTKLKNPSVVDVVYSAIDYNKFNNLTKGKLRGELGLSPKDKIIGNIAALADHKDHSTFIDCAEILVQNNPEFKFVIAGDGEFRPSLEAKAALKGLSDKIFFLGFRADVPNVIADFNIFLFTSKTEGLGTSILDAFAAGIPTVATAAGGIPEIVEDKKTGLLCPIAQPAELASAVLKILNNEEFANKLVHGASKKLGLFSLENLGLKTFEHYEIVLN
jgi:glycosyltransferase involved in cell wall biosynthesis